MHWLIQLTLLLAGLALFSLSLIFHLLSRSYSKPRRPFPSELSYIPPSDPSNPLPLPTLSDPASIALSIIVPAYNESLRLPGMLLETVEYLRKTHRKGDWEILVVDDGSKDDTVQKTIDLAKQEKVEDSIRIVNLTKNRGKGGAVKHGMLHSRGKRCLFVDADGASNFPDLQHLEKAMDEMQGRTGNDAGEDEDGAYLVLGSRAHMVNTTAVVQRSLLRNMLMKSFHTYLAVLGISSIRDTQCGFKLFSRAAVETIFPNLHVEGWIFDIEILLIATMTNAQVKEVPVQWKEVEGSKMDLVKDSIRMALDLLVIRGNYALGRWKVRDRKKVD